jgi:proliferating cell nuclear antigen
VEKKQTGAKKNMEARFAEGIVFKKLIHAINEFVPTVNLQCCSSGISLQAMTPSHICLIALHLPLEMFAHYHIEKPIVLGLNITSLFKLLKGLCPEDMLTLRVDAKKEQLILLFESSKRNTMLGLRLMDLDEEVMGIPDVDYHAIVQLKTEDFQDIVQKISDLDDFVMLTISKAGLSFRIHGNFGTGSILCTQGERLSVKTEVPETSASFNLKHLVLFSKAGSLHETILLRMTKDSPLVVEYKLATPLHDKVKGYLRFYLAPKSESMESESDVVN